jgi:hypothetical protein
MIPAADAIATATAVSLLLQHTTAVTPRALFSVPIAVPRPHHRPSRDALVVSLFFPAAAMNYFHRTPGGGAFVASSSSAVPVWPPVSVSHAFFCLLFQLFFAVYLAATCFCPRISFEVPFFSSREVKK